MRSGAGVKHARQGVSDCRDIGGVDCLLDLDGESMRRGVLIALLAFVLAGTTVHAEAVPVKVTGYCLKGTMANGEQTRTGVCAFRKEDIGKMARVYNADMELIGEYQICDTGKGGVRKGTVVDIWMETRAECFALTQNGFIEVVEQEEKH